MSNVSSTCGAGGPSVGFATPQLTAQLPCGFTITLPSFSIAFNLPSFSLSFFLQLFFNLNICDLSVAFDVNAGVAPPPYGGVISICVPDPSLSEQTLAAA